MAGLSGYSAGSINGVLFVSHPKTLVKRKHGKNTSPFCLIWRYLDHDVSEPRRHATTPRLLKARSIKSAGFALGSSALAAVSPCGDVSPMLWNLKGFDACVLE